MTNCSLHSTDLLILKRTSILFPEIRWIVIKCQAVAYKLRKHCSAKDWAEIRICFYFVIWCLLCVHVHFLCVLYKRTCFRFSTKESAAHAIVATHNTEVCMLFKFWRWEYMWTRSQGGLQALTSCWQIYSAKCKIQMTRWLVTQWSAHGERRAGTLTTCPPMPRYQLCPPLGTTRYQLCPPPLPLSFKNAPQCQGAKNPQIWE